MTTKTKTPTLDEARAQATAAAEALAQVEAKAQADAEQAQREAIAARVARSKRIVAEFAVIEAALSAHTAAAAKERDAAATMLDLQAMIDTEVAYQASVEASNIWRRRYNFALHTLRSFDDLDARTGPQDKPERRERPVRLFASGDTSATLLSRGIANRAHDLADTVLAEVLADLGLGDLAEEA